MSTTTKTETVKKDGITYVISDTQLTATLPGVKSKVRLSLVLDLERLFGLMGAVGAIDDDADVLQTMAALRDVIPTELVEATRGVDATLSLAVFMQWVTVLGERLGKAFT